MYIYCSSICTAEASTVQYMYCTVYVKQGWHAKLFILDHNFWTRNAKTSIKGLKDSNLSLVGNVNFSKTLWLSGWALGQATWTKWPKNYLTHGVTHKKSATHNQKFFYIANYKTCQVLWAFEQLSTAFGTTVTLAQSHVRSSCFGTKCLKQARCENVKNLKVLDYMES